MLNVEYQNNKKHDDFGGNGSGNMASFVDGWKDCALQLVFAQQFLLRKTRSIRGV